MVKVIKDQEQFKEWIQNFLPQLFDPEFELQPGQVTKNQIKNGRIMFILL